MSDEPKPSAYDVAKESGSFGWVKGLPKLEPEIADLGCEECAGKDAQIEELEKSVDEEGRRADHHWTMAETLRKRVESLAHFARLMLEQSWEGYDVDGGSIQDWALDCGIIHKEPGGYDPEKHGPADVQPGDSWFVFADWLRRVEDGGSTR